MKEMKAATDGRRYVSYAQRTGNDGDRRIDAADAVEGVVPFAG